MAVFERLVSPVLCDVLPGEGSIRLKLDLRGAATCLDILRHKDGFDTDVLDADGGALTNVVSTGPR